MAERDDLLASIAKRIADYREGEIAMPDSAHVDRWIKQFGTDVQLQILREMDHVLSRTYINRNSVLTFLARLLKTPKLAGKDPCAFWKGVTFLDIQKGGASQAEMLALLDELLLKECGVKTANCGKTGDTFVYLDDAVFSGGRVIQDLSAWVADAPAAAKLHIIAMAFHRYGQWRANNKLHDAWKSAGKKIDITWWRLIELEDRKAYTDDSDVLRPCTIPNNEEVAAYVDAMTHKPHLRNPGKVGALGIFSSEQGRNLLEQEFLTAGVKIRGMCPNLQAAQRPLGRVGLETLGFGATVVTFRNCPNNAPLAWWVAEPWYPLFTRSTNTDVANKKAFTGFTFGR